MPRNLNPECNCCGLTLVRDACPAPGNCYRCNNQTSAPPPAPVDFGELGFTTVDPQPVTSLIRCYTCESTFTDWPEYDNHYLRCDECDDNYCPRLDHYCDEYDDEPSSYRGSGIHGYSYTPELNFRGNGPYHLGIELEISTNNLDANPLYEWASSNGASDLFYAKQDGSVAGFEVVTHPMTPEWFLGFNWPGFFDMLKVEYPTYRNREPDGHGLHVHVSRTAFPKALDLCRWSYLINRNKQEVARIARRTSDYWAAFSKTPVKDTKPVNGDREWNYQYDAWGNRMVDAWGNYIRLGNPWFTARANGYPQTSGERYQALNVTNPETVECRVFKSTRDPQEFIDSVSLVAATVDFVRSMQPQHMTSVASLNWQQFVEWSSESAYAGSWPTFAATSIN